MSTSSYLFRPSNLVKTQRCLICFDYILKLSLLEKRQLKKVYLDSSCKKILMLEKAKLHINPRKNYNLTFN